MFRHLTYDDWWLKQPVTSYESFFYFSNDNFGMYKQAKYTHKSLFPLKVQDFLKEIPTPLPPYVGLLFFNMCGLMFYNKLFIWMSRI